MTRKPLVHAQAVVLVGAASTGRTGQMAGHRPLTVTATGRLNLTRGQVSTTPATVQWLNQGPEVLMQYDEIKQCLGSKPPRK